VGRGRPAARGVTFDVEDGAIREIALVADPDRLAVLDVAFPEEWGRGVHRSRVRRPV
jgi:hypothetical protein